MKKLASIAAITVALFLASYAAAFGLAMGVAHAQPAPAESADTGQAAGPPASVPAEDRGALGASHAAAGGHDDADHGGGHGDPSKHFNFLGGPFSHNGKDVVGGKYGDGKNFNPETGASVPGEEEPMSAPFIYMVLNFALLLGLLAWKGGPVFRKTAEDRHDQIKTALDEAARLRKQAQDKLTEYETRLKDADNEIKKMVDGMRADAEADKQRILDAAARQSAQMKKDAEQRIAAEIELARANLTREVTAAAAAATERLLRDKMQPADQQKLVASFIGDVQAAARKEIR